MTNAGTNERVTLISPYRGKLIDLLVSVSERSDLFAYAAALPSIQLTNRETCDLEMLATGAFSPLDTFMSERNYERVLADMRLADGSLFPIPVTLSTDDENIPPGIDVALRSPRNELLALLSIHEVYEWDRERFAVSVCGTADPRHPLVAEQQNWGRYNLTGELQVLKLPEYHDFREFRISPAQTRKMLADLGRPDVVAFQTRNPIHKGHESMMRRAIELTDGTLLLHPAVGMSKEGDIDYFTRVRTYKAVKSAAFEPGRALLGLVPLAMRFAGPREAIWHAIIRRNYGANHLIVGRDHACPGVNADGTKFYEPFAARDLARSVSEETEVKIVAFGEIAYLPDEARYEEVNGNIPGRKLYLLSGSQIREEFLSRGRDLPDWLTRKEVAAVLADSYPPRGRRGVCLWFTGLSGSGKSTTAEIVATLLLEEGRRTSLLDGDVIRTHLSKGLGFSRADRDANVSRVGFVASEIVRHGGIAICALISPYRGARNHVRQMFETGQFIEIFVDTPLDVCEKRDPKGMYARARSGQISGFTGIDDAYEIPVSPELTLETANQAARDNACLIIEYLREKGFLVAPETRQ